MSLGDVLDGDFSFSAAGSVDGGGWVRDAPEQLCCTGGCVARFGFFAAGGRVVARLFPTCMRLAAFRCVRELGTFGVSSSEEGSGERAAPLAARRGCDLGMSAVDAVKQQGW